MARANLNKSKKVLTSTTTELKHIPKRPKICISWNPPFQTSLLKIFKNCFLWSKFGSERGISIDADSGSLGYVLWCCGSKRQDFFSDWLWPYCVPFRFDRELHSCDSRNSFVAVIVVFWPQFCIGMTFFHVTSTFTSLFSLDFYFPFSMDLCFPQFLSGLLFPFSLWTSISFFHLNFYFPTSIIFQFVFNSI